MVSNAIVDSGPLIAAINRRDPDHEPCAAVLARTDLRLIVPALCLAEVSFLVGRRYGPQVEAGFFRDLDRFLIEVPLGLEWVRVAELIERYANLPLGATDATVVALAERYSTDLVVTLDHRHFSVVRPNHCKRLRLLPETTPGSG